MAQQRYLCFGFDYAGASLSWVNGNNVEASVDGGVTWTDVTSAKSVTATGKSCCLRAKTGSTPFYGLTSSDNVVSVSGHLGALIDYEAEDLDYVTVSDNQFSSVTLDASGNPDDNSAKYGLFFNDASGMQKFSLTSVKVQFPKSTTVGKWAYAHMFASALDISSSVSVNQMYLPATNLGVGCYYRMFYNWHSSKLPVTSLPAVTLSAHCYEKMFTMSNITSLPKINAEWVAPYCCANMFCDCDSLTKITDFTLDPLHLTKQISADGSVLQERADHCYESMFEGCTSISYINPYLLPAVDTAPYCYKNMFKNCDSYVTPNTLMILKLNADYVDEGAYYGMFLNCEQIKYVTINATSCYQVDANDADRETKAPFGYMLSECLKIERLICYLKYGGSDQDHLVENGFRDLNPSGTENYTTYRIVYSSSVRKNVCIPQSTYDTWYTIRYGTGTSTSSILGINNYWLS